MHYKLLAVIAGLLVASIPGAFAQSGPAFSTYQAWEFGATRDVLATSPIEDVSGDGADDLVVATQSKFSLLDGATGETVWTYVAGEASVWTAVMEYPDASGDGRPDVLASTKDSVLMLSINSFHARNIRCRRRRVARCCSGGRLWRRVRRK
jgi:hypothetical protein